MSHHEYKYRRWRFGDLGGQFLPSADSSVKMGEPTFTQTASLYQSRLSMFMTRINPKKNGD
jgi:hypothetical protein